MQNKTNREYKQPQTATIFCVSLVCWESKVENLVMVMSV